MNDTKGAILISDARFNLSKEQRGGAGRAQCDEKKINCINACYDYNAPLTHPLRNHF